MGDIVLIADAMSAIQVDQLTLALPILLWHSVPALGLLHAATRLACPFVGQVWPVLAGMGHRTGPAFCTCVAGLLSESQRRVKNCCARPVYPDPGCQRASIFSNSAWERSTVPPSESFENPGTQAMRPPRSANAFVLRKPHGFLSHADAALADTVCFCKAFIHFPHQ